jgi:hypothetical protein
MSPTQQAVLNAMTAANVAATDMVYELIPLAAAIVLMLIGLKFVKRIVSSV